MKKRIFIILLVVLTVLCYAEWIEIDQIEASELFQVESSGLEHTQVTFSLQGYETKEFTIADIDYQVFSIPEEGEHIEIGKNIDKNVLLKYIDEAWAEVSKYDRL